VAASATLHLTLWPRVGIIVKTMVSSVNAICAWYTCCCLGAGCGVEAAVGRLTRLTSLHLSVDRARTPQMAANPPSMQQPPQPSRILSPCPPVPLRLQLLGCSGATSSGSGSSGGCSSGGTAAGRNTGLQELALECWGSLSDAELAAAVAALPDLRRLDVVGGYQHTSEALVGLHGARLAAYGACLRLRHISLLRVAHVDGHKLVAQLPHIASLASLQVQGCPRVSNSNVAELQAAFRAKHGRHLSMDLQRTCDTYSYRYNRWH
jgi:hypothetical protein